ncbi:hypothetical protein NDN94_07530 [Burkholderia glumae]|uniref:hypothetical protein n=1 Tax=Burkholderia glumae TaxID=337 RepID=UPI0020372FC3|nr:hypothetical protein [Burkholderia glumae]MCM2537677.1 hypothetical protein [Burkholderia glumae]
MIFPDYVVIRVKRPEDYKDVCAELVAEDFLGSHLAFEWEYEVADEPDGAARDGGGHADR